MSKRDPIDLIQQEASYLGWSDKKLADNLFNGSMGLISHYMNKRMRLPASRALLANSLLGIDITEAERLSYAITPYPSASKQRKTTPLG
jgi:hypothetical protein